MELLNIKDIENRILNLRGTKVLLDTDVANLYGIATKEVNQAVSNNPEKFPVDYIIELSEEEKHEVVKNFDHLSKLKFSPHLPKAFTEKGLYMLATILKSPQAVQTTIAIIETFTKLRHLSRALNDLTQVEDESQQKTLMKKTGELFEDLISNELIATDSETTVELNMAFLKVKHTVKKKR